MKAKIKIVLEIETDIDVSVEDNGLSDRLDQILDDFKDDDGALDFQADTDEDATVKVLNYVVESIEMTGE
jgi:hypothetical protein